MLFHFSIAANEPERVCRVMAQFIGGEAMPFPPVSDNGWIALADDENRTAVEVYPLFTVLREVEGDADAIGELEGMDAYTATHAAIGTDLNVEEILRIAEREGWPAKYRKRGDQFGVIELWVEGRQMIELLTPEMQAEYRATTTIAGWKALLAAGPAPEMA